MGDRTMRSFGARLFSGAVCSINIPPLRGCLEIKLLELFRARGRIVALSEGVRALS